MARKVSQCPVTLRKRSGEESVVFMTNRQRVLFDLLFGSLGESVEIAYILEVMGISLYNLRVTKSQVQGKVKDFYAITNKVGQSYSMTQL